MRNILLGHDGSVSAAVALQQALLLSSTLSARLHLLQALEPVGPAAEVADLGLAEDPVSFLDRMDQMMSDDVPAPLPEDDDLAAAVRTCEEAGAVCSWKRMHGLAVRVLREHCPPMDLLILGRRGTLGRRLVGLTASSIISRPVVPTLLCRDTVIPLHRLLLAYEPTPVGGRALKLAGNIAEALNVEVDVVAADLERDRARRSVEQARTALRAYHVDGESIPHEGRLSDALQSAALEYQSSVVVVPHGRTGSWPWLRSDGVRAAIEYPTALALIVP
jgi:nucleotide-binding universal stress UspA family protein